MKIDSPPVAIGLLLSALFSALFSLLLPACSSSQAAGGTSADDGGGTSASLGSLAVDDAGAGTVTSIIASPLALVPPFSPSITDYYVRCASGSNDVTFTIQSSTGSQTSAQSLTEDQLVELSGSYFVRCLPHDFPVLTVTTYPDAGSPTPGWYLASNVTPPTGESSFAMVLDTNGTPVWYQRDSLVINVSSPAVDTLAFMPAGTDDFGTSATATFSVDLLDGGAAAALSAVETDTDSHELQFLPNGDHLVFTYVITPGVDLTGLETFGANETIADCTIQEVSPTGSLVWSWVATDHIDPVQESLEPNTTTVNGVTVVDPFHLNAIDVDSSGNLLVSSRHMSAVFYVEKATGTILWKLGGTSYNKDGAAWIQVVSDTETNFSMQHDARLQTNGDVTMFDDHGASAGVSRGVEYAIDHDAGTASVVWQFLGTEPSQYMGSFRRDADGESVIGWGYAWPDPRFLTEVNAAGADVFDVAFDTGNSSYRSIKVPLAQLDIAALRATAGP